MFFGHIQLKIEKTLKAAEREVADFVVMLFEAVATNAMNSTELSNRNVLKANRALRLAMQRLKKVEEKEGSAKTVGGNTFTKNDTCH